MTGKIKKTVAISGYTENSRMDQLKKKQSEFMEKGYSFVEYMDNGRSNSYAVFEIDANLIKKDEKNSTIAIWITLFVPIIIIIIAVGNGDPSDIPDSTQSAFQKYKNHTLENIKKIPVYEIKEIASSYTDETTIPLSYYPTMYDCFAERLYDKSETLTVNTVLTWCKEEYERPKNYTYANYVDIMEDFSPWDGSYRPLEKLLKENMNDPSSYEHVETRYNTRPIKKDLLIRTTYRGKNIFGATVTVTSEAKVDAKTKKITLLSTE